MDPSEGIDLIKEIELITLGSLKLQAILCGLGKKERSPQQPRRGLTIGCLKKRAGVF